MFGYSTLVLPFERLKGIIREFGATVDTVAQQAEAVLQDVLRAVPPPNSLHVITAPAAVPAPPAAAPAPAPAASPIRAFRNVFAHGELRVERLLIHLENHEPRNGTLVWHATVSAADLFAYLLALLNAVLHVVGKSELRL